MEKKKINGLMLGIFLLHIAVVTFITIMADKITIGVILNLSLGEFILLLPALVYLLFYKIKSKSGGVNLESVKEKASLKTRLHYNKVKPSTLGYVVLFTWLSMPLTTLINAVSMLFVDNTIVGMTDMILEVPFPIMLFIMAVMPACIEELVYRGIAYGGYRAEGTKFMAVLLSSAMFGLVHGNVNQAMYAFVLGILLALLFEATGSIFSTMLFHFLYNAQSCCIMFLVEAIQPGYYSNAANMTTTTEQLCMIISVYLIITAVTTPLAICLLYKIAKNEGRAVELMGCLPGKQKNREKLVTVTYIIATVIAVAYIIFEMVLSAMI